MSNRRFATSWRVFAIVTAILLIPQSLVGATTTKPPGSAVTLATGPDDTPTLAPGASPLRQDEESEEQLLALDTEFISKRLAGDHPLSLSRAGQLRAAAAHQAQLIRQAGPLTTGPDTFSGAWSQVGPNPIVQLSRGTPIFEAVAGRIGALAIRPSTGTFILGAAQGGIWTYNPNTGTWTPATDDSETQAIGALAIAPSDDAIVYAGTGEGALSGDSYFGNGVLKSTDGGQTWSHVSGDYFQGVSISRVVVDPTDADHLYASVLRGRGGARRTSPTEHSKFGIWESTDGGATWSLDLEQTKTNGATDLAMDPQNPDVLYASFWGDNVYKSTDGGAHWAAAMNGLPTKYNVQNQTRWAIGISHPAGQDAVVYVGSDYIDDTTGQHQPSAVWRSDDEGASWQKLAGTGFGNNPDDSVNDYCGTQCFYDNVIAVDPTNTDVVYALGLFNYGIGSGGVFRSDDGGQHWKNLGFDLHPDYHAFALNAANTNQVIIGSDGGVWFSNDRGGRLPGAADEADVSAADFVAGNLNGTVDPATAGVIHRTGLSIAQFTSIATVPTVPARLWGGTQDNGTLRKSVASNSWFDVASGDGGQVLVDPTDASYVYGTYFGISPYRYTDGGAAFFSNSYIRTGLNLNDRSEFYLPFVLNKDNPNQLFTGTFRMYRTDNAKAPSANAVTWKAISPDLTSGCTGTAPNGARGCVISAIGIGGGQAVYVGTDDGLMWISPDGKTASNPSWTRLDRGTLPKRPVAAIAVDRSNYRIAYAGYNGFSAATPSNAGHVFKTADGGQTWTNISGNLPDSPVNSLILDPSFPNTLYAGTDVGPFVTYDGGAHWSALGSGFPLVAIWQLDLDPSHGTLAAGTHGRGAFTIHNTQAVPALQVSKVDAGVPVGPSSNLDYTITVRNLGNADATGVSVSDPIPANTSFVSAADGGAKIGNVVAWTGQTVPAGGSISLHFRISIASALKKKITSITNDGITVTSAEGPGTTGSPTTTNIAPPYAVGLTPATQDDQSRVGTSVTYPLQLQNLGFNEDTYNVASSGSTFPVSLLQSDCTTALGGSVGPVAGGVTTDICVKVDIPAGAANNAVDTTTVTATSAATASVTASATVKTTAAAAATLLVDEDGNAPDVQSSYADALTAAGVEFNTWDLAAHPTLPSDFLNTFTNVVWFTGNAYPGPIVPYESELATYLDGGGRLMMSGQDILDQDAGTTAFVRGYLHINWDGSETQNDKATAFVAGITGNPVTDGIGQIPIDHSILGAAFEDRITPIAPATAAFNDDTAAADGLNVDTGTYKVVFLAFPFEAYGTATDKANLITKTFAWFAAP